MGGLRKRDARSRDPRGILNPARCAGDSRAGFSKNQGPAAGAQRAASSRLPTGEESAWRRLGRQHAAGANGTKASILGQIFPFARRWVRVGVQQPGLCKGSAVGSKEPSSPRPMDRSGCSTSPLVGNHDAANEVQGGTPASYSRCAYGQRLPCRWSCRSLRARPSRSYVDSRRHTSALRYFSVASRYSGAEKPTYISFRARRHRSEVCVP